MATKPKPKDEWRHVATVEVVDTSDALEHLIDDHPSCYRVEHSRKCASGCSGFEIYVDFGIGGRQAAHAAYAVLMAMQKAAMMGMFRGYRVVSGNYWRDLALILGHDVGSIDAPPQEAPAATKPKGVARSTAPRGRRKWSSAPTV
jgi:hypothetical protein